MNFDKPPPGIGMKLVEAQTTNWSSLFPQEVQHADPLDS